MTNRSTSYKLVLLGESAVGKSSIALRFVKSQFQEFQEATIGAAYLTQSIVVGDPQVTVKFEIWDTAGMFHVSFILCDVFDPLIILPRNQIPLVNLNFSCPSMFFLFKQPRPLIFNVFFSFCYSDKRSHFVLSQFASRCLCLCCVCVCKCVSNHVGMTGLKLSHDYHLPPRFSICAPDWLAT